MGECICEVLPQVVPFAPRTLLHLPENHSVFPFQILCLSAFLSSLNILFKGAQFVSN